MRSKNSPSFLGSEWDLWLNRPHTNSPQIESKRKESYYFIFNCEINELEYISSSILDVLGYTAEEFDLNKLFLSIHPDDLDYCNKCENNSFQLRDRVFYKELFTYLISYSFRLRTKAGNYITIKQQYQTIETDEYGKMFKNFVHHEKIDDYEARSEFDFQIIDKLKNRSINFSSKFKLTKREVEILDLINEGYQSKEISEILNVSHHTIRTHRKNILSKTKSSSLIEALKKTGV